LKRHQKLEKGSLNNMAAVYRSPSALQMNYHRSRYQQPIAPTSAFVDVDCSPALSTSNATTTTSNAFSQGGTTAVASSFGSSTGIGGWDSTSNAMMRTDVFPFLATDDVCTPRGAQTQASPSSFLGGFTGTTQLHSSTHTTTSTSTDVSDADTSADGLDFTGTIPTAFDYDGPAVAPGAVPVWGLTSIPSSSTTTTSSHSLSTTSTGTLPSSSLTMKREESLGKAIGFEPLPEIDAAPLPSLYVPPSLAYDVAPASIPSPSASSAISDFSGLNFEFGFSDNIGAFPAPTVAAAASAAAAPAASTLFKFDEPVVKLEEEPDASSVSDVDAASDGWSMPDSPASPSSPASIHSPNTTSMAARVRGKAYVPAHITTTAVLDAAAALRPGPYTRGRAAALAAPVAPKELKPVPVARGPHAGLLGGGEMASVGIYTKDDRWRKIERLREKRRARIVVKSNGGQYACRKSFADRRPRVGGRFVKMDEETKRYLSLTKPGANPPPNLQAPPALRAYAATTVSHGATTHSPVPLSTATHSSTQIPHLAAAARAASMSSASTPLFGTSMAPPMPAYPSSAWGYGYPTAPSSSSTSSSSSSSMQPIVVM